MGCCIPPSPQCRGSAFVIQALIYGFLPHCFCCPFSSYRYIFYAVCPVAYPGGPRKKTITRLVQHPDKEHEFRYGWKFLHANESHKHTNARFKGARLTGETAGRQIWIKEMGPSSSLSPVDQKKQKNKKNPVRRSCRMLGNNKDHQSSFFFNPSR